MSEILGGLSTADLSASLERQPADALLSIGRAGVKALREEHGIYMAESGRINVAGLRTETIAPFVAAFVPHLTPTERLFA